jgi:hypothetical protein
LLFTGVCRYPQIAVSAGENTLSTRLV